MGVFELITVFINSLLTEQTLGCVGFHNLAQRWRVLTILAGDGERNDLEGWVVVHLAHGCKEYGHEGQDEEQHCVWELLDSKVAHHCDLADEQRYNDSGVDMGPHSSSTLKVRHIYLQSLQKTARQRPLSHKLPCHSHQQLH